MKIMKKIILVRHGSYNETNGCLTDEGIKQINQLAGKLVEHVGGQSIALLSSDAVSASQSASIINAKLTPSKFFTDGVLFSSPSHIVRSNDVIDLIFNYNDSDIIILVTHYEYFLELPVLIGQRIVKVNFSIRMINNGHATVFDCEHKRDWQI